MARRAQLTARGGRGLRVRCGGRTLWACWGLPMMLAGALALVVVAGTGGPVAGVAHRGADLLPTLQVQLSSAPELSVGLQRALWLGLIGDARRFPFRDGRGWLCNAASLRIRLAPATPAPIRARPSLHLTLTRMTVPGIGEGMTQ